jgi:hypothetical protein
MKPMRNGIYGEKIMVKGIWNGKSDEFELIAGKEYEIVGTDFRGKFASTVDETGEDFLYPLEDFTITQGEEELKQMIEEDIKRIEYELKNKDLYKRKFEQMKRGIFE